MRLDVTVFGLARESQVLAEGLPIVGIASDERHACRGFYSDAKRLAKAALAAIKGRGNGVRPNPSLTRAEANDIYRFRT